MDSFYLQAGNLLAHHISSTGESPTRTWICTFMYEYGEASFDGKDWEFHLYR